jgi:hypothetical protein
MTTIAAPLLGIPEPAVLTDKSAVVRVSSGADADVGVTVVGMGRAVAFGLTVGSLGAYLLSLVIGLAAGLGAGTAAGMAVLPGIFGGLFGGGGPMLLTQLLRFEKQERRSLHP